MSLPRSSPKTEFRRHEAVIEKGLATFFEVGTALRSIRDNKLYRQTHSTFEDYCRDRWDFSKTHANRQIAAAAVVGHLAQIGVKPKNIEQTKHLVRLNPDQCREAWELAKERADGGEPTTWHIEQAVAKVAPRIPAAEPRQAKGDVAKAKKNRERREKQQKLEQEKADKSRREAWEKDIVAVRTPEKWYGGSTIVGSGDVDAAIANTLSKMGTWGPGDVSLFRAGQLVGIIVFDADGPPVVIRRDELPSPKQKAPRKAIGTRRPPARTELATTEPGLTHQTQELPGFGGI